MASLTGVIARVSALLALRRFPLVHTRSLDLATQLQSSLNARVETEQIDRKAAFEWEANRLALGDLAVVASRYDAAVRGKTESVGGMFSLLVPLQGAAVSKQAGKSVVLAPARTGALVSSAMPAEIELSTGYRGLSVRIPAALLESTLDVLTGVQRATALRFDMPVDLAREGGAGCLRLLEFIVGEAEHEDSVLRAPIVEGRLTEAFVTALLLGLRHNHSHLLRTPSGAAEPRHVKRAEEFLSANAHRPVTLAEVARAAGVGARALQTAFKAHRGVSPFEFLRERRFALSRARLQASAANTVAEAAVASGFEHLGRFSMEYKRRYGESPAQTLRRARTEPGTRDPKKTKEGNPRFR